MAVTAVTAPGPASREVGLAPRPALPFALLGGGGAVLLTGSIVGLVAVKQAGDAPTRNGPEARSARSIIAFRPAIPPC